MKIFQESINWKGIAIDKNIKAINLTKKNALNVLENKYDERLTLINATFHEYALQKHNYDDIKFDFIISNPPYIPSAVCKKLDKQIQYYESSWALDGGPDGLDVIIEILNNAHLLLKDNGYVFLEVDKDHPLYLKNNLKSDERLHKCKLNFIEIVSDIFGEPRFVVLRKN